MFWIYIFTKIQTCVYYTCFKQKFFKFTYKCYVWIYIFSSLLFPYLLLSLFLINMNKQTPAVHYAFYLLA